jgi:long-subunit fatty acid transport protein
MKKKFAHLGTVAALLVLSGGSQAVHAQAKAADVSGPYVEAAYLATTFKSSGNPSLKPTAVRLAAGMDVISGLAVEGMLAFGAQEGKSGTSQAELSTLAGVYVKPHAELAPGLEVIARAGFANMAWSTQTGAAAAVKHSGNSAGYGLGLSYKVADKITAGADYMSYYNKDSVKLTGFTISVGMKF